MAITSINFDLITKIVGLIVSIVSAFSIFTKLKEFFEFYEKIPFSKSNKIKRALENPYLSNKQKQSLGRSLSKEYYRKVYKFSPPIGYIDKIIKIEQKSEFTIDMEHFANASLNIDFENGNIIVRGNAKRFKTYMNLNLWLSLILVILGFFGFGYIVTRYTFIAGFLGLKQLDIINIDWVYLIFTPIYILAGFMMRDDVKRYASLMKIVEFGRINSTLITIPSLGTNNPPITNNSPP